VSAVIVGQLEAFIARRVGDRETARDITQEVLLRLYEAGPGLTPRDVPAWLYRVARNAVIDHYRTRRRPDPLPAGLQQPADIGDNEPTAAITELAGCIRPLVKALPGKYAEAVTLVDLDRHTHIEAAAMTGISVSGMKSRVQRGRRLLLDSLSQCCAVQLGVRGDIIGYEPAPGGCHC
jgi:RNA polymerase sigma-70 factor, ECF subfamily